ncbi:uncharacterized protein [Halyomorpha halys]|uniref:uncharacterized protein n=1 Tax=Halyomorpha halys TaxID=286706 RepID=UPI0006D4CA0B|nr:uncharacterized protein LOC106677974 isoform X2 [Halyomorpha halys]
MDYKRSEIAMQDFLYREWSKPPYYDSLCRSRERSPLKIRESVEEKGRIDSVTNVHRKYLLYSSESRCVHLFQEKVTRYVRPMRRYRPEKLRSRNTDCSMYSHPLRSWTQTGEANSDHRLPTYRPCSHEQFLSNDYLNVKSTKSQSCHSYLNMDISPDVTSPRFVRPCRMNKELNVRVMEENKKKVPAIEMQPPQPEAELMEIQPVKNVKELKHFMKHYLSEKCSERLEGSTLLMDALSLIMSTISPYVNRLLYLLWRVKCLADRALHLCIDYNIAVE